MDKIPGLETMAELQEMYAEHLKMLGSGAINPVLATDYTYFCKFLVDLFTDRIGELTKCISARIKPVGLCLACHTEASMVLGIYTQLNQVKLKETNFKI